MGAQRRESSVLTGCMGGCLEEVVGGLQAEREPGQCCGWRGHVWLELKVCLVWRQQGVWYRGGSGWE